MTRSAALKAEHQNVQDGDSMQQPICRTRGRPPLKNKDSLKKRIIDEAFKTFSEHQYRGTTMDLVAARCKISKRTLYEVFPSKVDLFTAMAQAHREEVVELPGNYDDVSLEEAMSRIFRLHISEKEEVEQYNLLRLFFFESSNNSELEGILIKHCGEELHDLVEVWVRHEVSRGRIVSDNTRQTAKYIMDVILAARLMTPPASVAPGIGFSRKEYLKTCVSYLARGLSPQK